MAASLRDVKTASGWPPAHDRFFSDSPAALRPAAASQTAIQPVIIGANATTLAFAEALRERHMFVPAIRPPTVPAGTARLRVSLSAAMSADDLFDLITAITDLENILMREPS
jgi:7-keto-8-aminopelargonate synthetase-like enzyme